MQIKNVACALAVGLATLACGTKPAQGTQDAGWSVNPCTLLTTDQVSGAIGETVGAGVESGVNAPSCTWTAASGAGATLDAPIDPSSVGTIAPGEQGNSAITLKPVSGLGDAAYFTEDGTIAADLAVRKGTKAFDISLAQHGFTLDQIESGEQMLAQDVLANL